MFCPQCKAEYREGFYRCADCNIDLVWHLEEPAARAQLRKDESSVVLWRGQDPVVYTSLLNSLREAQIPFHDRAMCDPEGLYSSSFPAYLGGPGFEIQVLVQDLGRAQAALESVLESLEKLAESPAATESPSQPIAAATHVVSRDCAAEEAVAVAWSGDDEEMAEFLHATLCENGIPCRALAEPVPTRILVCPEDEARARQIVREVLEGWPPG
jgi:hypothetical protein